MLNFFLLFAFFIFKSYIRLSQLSAFYLFFFTIKILPLRYIFELFKEKKKLYKRNKKTHDVMVFFNVEILTLFFNSLNFCLFINIFIIEKVIKIKKILYYIKVI